jgi:hypothetical protein
MVIYSARADDVIDVRMSAHGTSRPIRQVRFLVAIWATPDIRRMGQNGRSDPLRH